MKSKMRILVVSRNFHEKVVTMVHGTFKRFQIFLEAIRDIAEIDLLYYVSPSIDRSPESVAKYETALVNHFKVPLNLYLCPLNHRNSFFNKSMSYVKGVFSIVYQPEYSGTTGSLQLQALKGCLKRKPNAVLVHRLGVMSPFLSTCKKPPTIFFDLDDIEHVAFKRRLPYLPKFRSKIAKRLLYPALCNGEKKAIQLARRTFVCSKNDLEYLQNKWGVKGLIEIPNSIAIPTYQEVATDHTLLFLGSYSYKPNVDAAEFLIRKIWPIIHAKVPSAKLLIAGAAPDRLVDYRDGVKGVTFSGFVEDLDALYRQTRVVCAPILSGGGTRVKILEAAAYGKPVVSTRMGAEGLEMRDGSDIIIRDDPLVFADACITLLNDYDKCCQIGNAGRMVVTQHYDKKKVIEKIKKTLLGVIVNP